MDGLGMSILEEGIEQGIERGMKQGIERGMKQGIERGKAKQMRESVTSLMRTLGLSQEEACRALNIEMSDYEKAKQTVK